MEINVDMFYNIFANGIVGLKSMHICKVLIYIHYQISL